MVNADSQLCDSSFAKAFNANFALGGKTCITHNSQYIQYNWCSSRLHASQLTVGTFSDSNVRTTPHTVGTTATQSTWSTISTIGVDVLPLLSAGQRARFRNVRNGKDLRPPRARTQEVCDFGRVEFVSKSLSLPPHRHTRNPLIKCLFLWNYPTVHRMSNTSSPAS